MIPAEKIHAVTRGLEEAFGITSFEEIDAVHGGQTSSLVYRIVVGGKSYLLKIILRTDDPTRHYTCMRAAAEAGVAPHLRYASVADRISITDLVAAAPLPVDEARTQIPALLRKLHALPAFPAPGHLNTSCTFLLSPGIAREQFLEKFRAAAIFPAEAKQELLDRCAELTSIYPRVEHDLVSSHNDLFKPDNLVFDGDRLWLVDWETAFRNDRYADLAVMAHLVVRTEEEEQTYLSHYFGREPDEYERARFFLMLQLSLVFYALAFLWMGSAGGSIDLTEGTLDFAEFQRRIWTGEVRLADTRMKSIYGQVYRKQFLRNCRLSRYAESWKIIATRHGSV